MLRGIVKSLVFGALGKVQPAALDWMIVVQSDGPNPLQDRISYIKLIIDASTGNATVAKPEHSYQDPASWKVDIANELELSGVLTTSGVTSGATWLLSGPSQASYCSISLYYILEPQQKKKLPAQWAHSMHITSRNPEQLTASCMILIELLIGTQNSSQECWYVLPGPAFSKESNRMQNIPSWEKWKVIIVRKEKKNRGRESLASNYTFVGRKRKISKSWAWTK